MVGIRHIRNLDNQIQLKQIDIKDNSAKLKLLDKKYTDLNSELNKKDADKAKIEQDLKNLQKEKEQLTKDLQAKRDAKEKVIAQATLGAVGQTASAQPAPVGNIEQIVRQAALKYGVDPDYLVRIARCESGMNSSSVNYSYYENGNPSGLFQHISGYYPARAIKYGYSTDVFDAYSNANVTAAMFRDGLQGLWECH